MDRTSTKQISTEEMKDLRSQLTEKFFQMLFNTFVILARQTSIGAEFALNRMRRTGIPS